MNETQLRELLSDRAAVVSDAPDRYGQVRRRVTARRRAYLAGAAASLVLALVGVGTVVARLDDPGRVEVANGLGWAPRGALKDEPGVLDKAVAAWGGEAERVSLLFAGHSADRATGGIDQWVIFEARSADRATAVLVAVDGAGYRAVATAEPAPNARSLGFVGTYAGSPRDGLVVVLLAPGLEQARLAGTTSTERALNGVVALPFRQTDVASLRVELFTSSLVATERPAGQFVLRGAMPKPVDLENVQGADPRALGWAPRISRPEPGADCETAVFCGPLDAGTFGSLHVLPGTRGPRMAVLRLRHADGTFGSTVLSVRPPGRVVAGRIPVKGTAQLFLIAAPDVTRFEIESGGGSREVAAEDGWAWVPAPGRTGTVTAYAGSRVAGTTTY